MVSVMKHALKQNWQDAYVEEKICDLVKVLNRTSLGMCTIAACEGHLKYPNSPYVFFKGPDRIAGLIAKRIFLAQVRNEGLFYDWCLIGSFNKDFELCFTLSSRPFEQAYTDGVISGILFYLVRRHRIDDDLSLLARLVGELLDKLENAAVVEIQNPYDEKYHSAQKAPKTRLSFFCRHFT